MLLTRLVIKFTHLDAAMGALRHGIETFKDIPELRMSLEGSGCGKRITCLAGIASAGYRLASSAKALESASRYPSLATAARKRCFRTLAAVASKR